MRTPPIVGTQLMYGRLAAGWLIPATEKCVKLHTVRALPWKLATHICTYTCVYLHLHACIEQVFTDY